MLWGSSAKEAYPRLFLKKLQRLQDTFFRSAEGTSKIFEHATFFEKNQLLRGKLKVFSKILVKSTISVEFVIKYF